MIYQLIRDRKKLFFTKFLRKKKQKNSSNQLYSKFVSKTITFTKFLPKKRAVRVNSRNFHTWFTVCWLSEFISKYVHINNLSLLPKSVFAIEDFPTPCCPNITNRGLGNFPCSYNSGPKVRISNRIPVHMYYVHVL